MGISWCRISPYRFFDISHALDLRRYKGVEPLGKVGHLSTLWVPGSVGSCVGLESRMWEKKKRGRFMYVCVCMERHGALFSMAKNKRVLLRLSHPYKWSYGPLLITGDGYTKTHMGPHMFKDLTHEMEGQPRQKKRLVGF